ncbi:MAG: hypothetical protein QM757_38495 [Paludibaculum sp.]
MSATQPRLWGARSFACGSHELFRRKLGLQPYYSVEHKGFHFIHLNNFLGDTWQPGHAKLDKKVGSLTKSS